jgi:hypothetical protein
MSNETRNEFTPIEANEYLLRMGKFKEAPTKNGKGRLISAGFEVVSGEFKGRLVFHNFLTEHTTPKAQEIGREQLSNYLSAVGVEGGLEGINQDLTQLENYTELPFIGKVVIEDPQEYMDASGVAKTSKARNKIVAFKAR